MRRLWFGWVFAVLLAVGSGTERWADVEDCVIRRGKTVEKVVAITVDDGPYPQATERMLDVLKEHDVKATFFILGKSAVCYPDMVRRTVAEGHEVASHGYSHANMAKLSRDECRAEWKRTEEVLALVGIDQVTLFRPPSGAYGQTLTTAAQERGYRVILWDVDPRDWEGASADMIAKRILGAVHSGSIILLHDGQYPIHSADALREVIPRLRSEGYSFVTVGELLRGALCGSKVAEP